MTRCSGRTAGKYRDGRAEVRTTTTPRLYAVSRRRRCSRRTGALTGSGAAAFLLAFDDRRRSRRLRKMAL